MGRILTGIKVQAFDCSVGVGADGVFFTIGCGMAKKEMTVKVTGLVMPWMVRSPSILRLSP